MCRWLVFFLLAGCGGGSSTAPSTPTASVPPPVQVPPIANYDVRDFWPARASRVASGWTATLTSPTTFTLAWPGIEEFRIAPNPADGDKLWLHLDAYGTIPQRLVSWADRTEVNRNDGRGWAPVTALTHTTPYLPITIPLAGVSVRSWGWITLDDRPLRRWFHIQTVTFAPAVLNSCWQAGPPGNVKDALQQQEAWYDDAGLWSDRGQGPLDPATREPTGDSITYYMRNFVAQGPQGGPLWVGDNQTTGQRYCLFF